MSDPKTNTKTTAVGPQHARDAGAELPAFDDPDRYEARGELGEGGMGRVALVHDRILDRDVARKSIRPDRDREAPALRRRFVVEARLQGRLQHPAILPVYDMGANAAGEPYFTMRPIDGRSLAEAIADEGAPHPRRPLLEAVSRVALAVDFAHERGVIHCDLKPHNIMVGSFGEVYVVDWGAARAVGAASSAVVGSPAYMAPEQAEGRDHLIGPASDVFSLGAILFEVATGAAFKDHFDGDRLHDAALADVPEPLAVLCVKATAADPTQRFASARALHEALQAFLDGEVDQERRIEESAALAREAKAAAQRLVAADDEIEERQHAIRSVGRALALDPTNPLALEALLELIETPMQREPEEIGELTTEQHAERTRRMGKVAALAYAGQLLHLPVFLYADVKEPGYLVVFYGCMVLTALCAYWTHRRPSDAKIGLCLAVSTVGTAAMAGLVGPLLAMPMIVIVNVIAFGMSLRGRLAAVPLVVGALGLLVPLLLSKTGVLPDPYTFGEHGITVAAPAIAFDASAEVVLLVINLATLVVGALVISLMTGRVEAVERRLFAQTWHFRQLLPGQAKMAPSPGG